MSQRDGAGSVTTRSTPPAQELTTSKLTTEDLEVTGTTSTVHSTNTVISDKLLELANGTTGTPSGDVGIVIERGSSDNAAIIWDESADCFVLGTTSATGASTGDLTVTSALSICTVGSAVNYMEIENAASGSAPSLSALGDSTNITMSLKPKGTGGVRIFGSAAGAANIMLNEDSDNGTNFTKIQAAANIASNHTYTLPAALPAANKILQTDSSGSLSWVDDAPPANDLNVILHSQVFS